MRMYKRHGYLAAIAMVAALVGVAVATVVNNSTEGAHELTLNSSTNSLDTGVGLFTLNNSDSSVRNGIFFANGRLADTWLAFPGTIDGRGGTGKLLTGKAASTLNSASSFYVQMSDTARTSVSTTFTDSATSSGSWSGTLTSNSGTCTSKFGYGGGRFSSTAVEFGDSTRTTAGGTVNSQYPMSNIMSAGDSVTRTAAVTETRIAVVVRSGIDSNTNDTMRIIVISPAGKIVGDSQMTRNQISGVACLDSTWLSPMVRFETGINKVVIIYWDAAQAKYGFITGQINAGSADNAVTGGAGTFTYVLHNNAPLVGQLSRFDITLQPSTPTVTTVQLLDPAGDGAVKSDNYANVDSNTSGFDTRLANTVIAINLFDAGGNPITQISGARFLLVIKYNFGGLSSAQASNIRLLHRDAATNTWEAVSASTPDSASGTLVAYIDEFSEYAMGTVNATSTPSAVDNDNCVINNAVGGTGLAGIMPSLRGVRDTILSTAIGRLMTSGYYTGFFITMIVAGFGLMTVARRRA